MNYYEAASYVGSIAAILALFAVLCSWRRRSTIAFAVIAITTLATLFVSPVALAFGKLPVLREVGWGRVALPLGLALAALAGMGLETVRRDGFSTRVLRRLSLSTGVFAAVILIWWFGRHTSPSMPSGQRSAEAQAFLAPVVGIATVVAVIVGIGFVRKRASAAHRRRRGPFAHSLEIACALLLFVETGFLLTAHPEPVVVLSSEFFATSTAGDGSPSTKVGNARVGDGACTSLTLLPADIGILPDDNVMYGVSQLAVYDPAIPERYFQFWSKLTGAPLGGALPPGDVLPHAQSRSARPEIRSLLCAGAGWRGPTRRHAVRPASRSRVPAPCPRRWRGDPRTQGSTGGQCFRTGDPDQLSRSFERFDAHVIEFADDAVSPCRRRARMASRRGRPRRTHTRMERTP